MSSLKPVEIAFTVTEPTEGLDENLPPIIMLHGLTQSKETWTTVDQPIADATRRQVYKLDTRNHGDSEWSNEFSFDVLAEDVCHFMNQQNVPRAILLGHSLGGRIAMEVAGKHPEKVEKLIVEDMTPKRMEDRHIDQLLMFLDLYDASVKAVPKETDMATAADLVKKFLLGSIPSKFKTRRLSEVFDIRENLRQTSEGFRWKTNVDVIREAVAKRVEGFMGLYDGDTLFVFGTESPYKIKDDEDIILKKFPKAVLKGVDDASHFVHREQPEEFARIVLDFIKKS